jgi:hypothetical protein
MLYMNWYYKFHGHGFKGAGTAMVLLDGGYSTLQPGHELLSVTANMMNSPTDNHAVAGGTLVTGKDIGKGFVSIAPDAELYMTNIYAGAGACIAWGLQRRKPGQRMVFCIPYLNNPDAYYREQVKKAKDAS